MLVKNKKALFEFDVKKTIISGVVLHGYEVKSLRLKHASLTGSYVKVIGDEVFLLNAQINLYPFATVENYDPKRTRKLLLHKKEIFEIKESSAQKGWALVPMSFFIKGRQIKLEIGIGRGKKEFEKRAIIKERDVARELSREMKDAR